MSIETAAMASRLHALDGLRGLLALYILAGHSLPLLWPGLGLGVLGGIVAHGRAAVDLFFCLSGLVILHSVRAEGMAGPGGARRFLALRAGRLVPVYLLALGFACLSLGAGNPYPLMPWLSSAPPAALRAVQDILSPGWPPDLTAHLAAHLFFIHGLLPPALLPNAQFALLGPAWSLSTEWQFYALVGVLLWRRPGWLRPSLMRPSLMRPSLMRPALISQALLLLGLVGLTLPFLLPLPWHFGRAFLPRAAWYFALGMASVAPLEQMRPPPRALAIYGLALAASLGMSGIAGGLPAMLVPLAWTACLLAQRRSGRLFRAIGGLLCWRPLISLGAISYPLYLLHMPLQRLLILALAPLAHGRWPLFSLLWAPPALLLPLCLAGLAHRYIEEPGRRWSRGRILGNRSLTPSASGSNTSAAARL